MVLYLRRKYTVLSCIVSTVINDMNPEVMTVLLFSLWARIGEYPSGPSYIVKFFKLLWFWTIESWKMCVNLVSKNMLWILCRGASSEIYKFSILYFLYQFDGLIYQFREAKTIGAGSTVEGGLSIFVTWNSAVKIPKASAQRNIMRWWYREIIVKVLLQPQNVRGISSPSFAIWTTWTWKSSSRHPPGVRCLHTNLVKVRLILKLGVVSICHLKWSQKLCPA